MKIKKPILLSSALLATAILGTSALSQIARERAYPTEYTHATDEMVRAFPDLF